MNKVAIYPGTFDPITYGHIDVIKKALKLFDKIVVGVSNVSNKNYLFSSEERIHIVNKALFNDLKLNKKCKWSQTEHLYLRASPGQTPKKRRPRAKTINLQRLSSPKCRSKTNSPTSTTKSQTSSAGQ